MAQTFTFDIAPGKSVDEILAKAREAGRGKGIALVGDATKGTFQGAAQGSYSVQDRRLTVTVEKKPVFVPWMMIENALRDVFSA